MKLAISLCHKTASTYSISDDVSITFLPLRTLAAVLLNFVLPSSVESTAMFSVVGTHRPIHPRLLHFSARAQ